VREGREPPAFDPTAYPLSLCFTFTKYTKLRKPDVARLAERQNRKNAIHKIHKTPAT
jgi:hypothetical protein